MYIEHRYVHHAYVLDCCGRFDHTDRPQFMKIVETLLAKGCRCLILNLTSLYFLDPQIIPDLVFTHEYLHESSATLLIVSPLSFVRSELISANVQETIPIYSTVYDALHRPHLAVSQPTCQASYQRIRSAS